MKMNKTVATALTVFMSFGFFATDTFAAAAGGCVDEDNDGYYIGDDPNTSACKDRLAFKGVEKAICDCPDLRVGQRCAGAPLTYEQILPLFDPDKVQRQMRGRQFHPGVPDTAGDGIDQDCDGEDLPVGGGGANNVTLGDLIEKGVNILSMIVAGVSTLFLIWGAIMYATAAGEEEKTKKARKTMIGAIVGLIVGIMAGQVIRLVIGWVTD